MSQLRVINVPSEDLNCRGVIGISGQLWKALHLSGIIVKSPVKGKTCYLHYKSGDKDTRFNIKVICPHL